MIATGELNRKFDIIDMRDTMYPSYSLMIKELNYEVASKDIGWSTLMGFSLGKTIITVGDEEHTINPNQYFSFKVKNKNVKFNVIENNLFAVFRLGFLGANLIGELELNEKGKLSYIDGCSDSLLVYPPRLGDPSLNYLYFPEGINQSFHTHPSIRIGCVIDGHGYSDTKISQVLKRGDFFCLEEHELHRFKTEGSEMKIIAFHPDGDWGPTDENHTMLNRTYLKK